MGDDRAVKVPAACRHSVTDAKRQKVAQKNIQKKTPTQERASICLTYWVGVLTRLGGQISSQV